MVNSSHMRKFNLNTIHRRVFAGGKPYLNSSNRSPWARNQELLRNFTTNRSLLQIRFINLSSPKEYLTLPSVPFPPLIFPFPYFSLTLPYLTLPYLIFPFPHLTLPYLTSGRNSQSIGGMSAGGDDSDQESFVSRVGSFALTDIGQGTSDRGGSSGRALMHPGGGVIGAGGGAGGIFSPTSTVLRSTTVSLARMVVLMLAAAVNVGAHAGVHADVYLHWCLNVRLAGVVRDGRYGRRWCTWSGMVDAVGRSKHGWC